MSAPVTFTALQATEPYVRLAAFVAIFGAMALFEIVAPRRVEDQLRGRRWPTNLAILAVSSVMLRLVFPAAAVGAAVYAETRGYGLLRALDAPPLLAGIVAFVALDFAVWLEHVASHKLPWLWRIHRVHHADIVVDLTTALRFHPVEIVLSMLWKAAVVLALGPPVLAVLVFEIVLNGMAMFNHANAAMPPALDRALRLLVVTPDMHRVHHSVDRRETDSNYGFNLSVWDRLFGVYTPQPRDGHAAMTIGLKEYRDRRPTRLFWSLALPFGRGRS